LLYGVTHGGVFSGFKGKSRQGLLTKILKQLLWAERIKNKQNMHGIIDWTTDIIDPQKTTHMLGIGEVDDIFEIIERGIDTFDCVIPTRIGRTGFSLLRRRWETQKTASEQISISRNL